MLSNVLIGSEMFLKPQYHSYYKQLSHFTTGMRKLPNFVHILQFKVKLSLVTSCKGSHINRVWWRAFWCITRYMYSKLLITGFLKATNV